MQSQGSSTRCGQTEQSDTQFVQQRNSRTDSQRDTQSGGVLQDVVPGLRLSSEPELSQKKGEGDPDGGATRGKALWQVHGGHTASRYRWEKLKSGNCGKRGWR